LAVVIFDFDKRGIRMATLRTSWVVAIAVLLGLSAIVRSADPPLNSPEQKVLDRFLGSWRTNYKLLKAEWTPEEKQLTADYVTSRELGERFIQERSKHSDGGTGLSLSTYDPERKCYRGWWFSSTGQTSESTGKWDADARTMTWTSTGDQPMATTARQRFVDTDTLEWDVVVRDRTGKVYFRMEGKSTRVKDAMK
jgi:hypothetical protein